MSLTQSGVTRDDRVRIEKLGATAERIRTELRKKIVGLDDVIEDVMIAIFCGGHSLLVGVPGLAKTLLISSLARTLSLKFSRIQFTPDLMPSDITGTELIASDPATGERGFRFVPGPIFANIVLADEINRTPPKTQAALMEALEERQVTCGGKKHVLDRPFLVLATQNPIEQEGTYPLPVAQLDRFMFNVFIDYPGYEQEMDIIRRTTSGYDASLQPFISQQELLDLQGIVRKLDVSREVHRYAMALARATRPGQPEAPDFVEEWLSWGAGPRAGHYMILGAKARAMLAGRTDVRAEDVRTVAGPVLRHRILTTYHAEQEGMDADRIIDKLLHTVPAPDGGPVTAAEGNGEASWLQRLFGA